MKALLFVCVFILLSTAYASVQSIVTIPHVAADFQRLVDEMRAADQDRPGYCDVQLNYQNKYDAVNFPSHKVVMHNMQETPTDVFEYQGYYDKLYDVIAKTNIKWRTLEKKEGSYLVNSSPAFDFALFTACALMPGPQNKCRVVYRGCTIDIKVSERSVKRSSGIKNMYINSVFPIPADTQSGTCQTTHEENQLCCLLGNMDEMESEELTATNKEVNNVTSSCDGTQEETLELKVMDDESTIDLSTARSFAGFDDFCQPDIVCYDEPMICYDEPVMFCEPAPIFAPTFGFGFGCPGPTVVEEEVVVHHRPNYVRSTAPVVYQQPPQQVVVQQPQQSKVVYQPQQSRVVANRPRRKSTCICC
ncbi:Endoribonuclease [Aphelenchoides besseyi]|nr:Endoribonuclease [Aphelenchoides besseyi]